MVNKEEQLSTTSTKEESTSSAIPARLLVTEVEMGGVEQTSSLTGTEISS